MARFFTDEFEGNVRLKRARVSQPQEDSIGRAKKIATLILLLALSLTAIVIIFFGPKG